MVQSKITLCNQEISVPNSKRKVTRKTCLESLLGKISPKSIFLIPHFFTWFPSSYFWHFFAFFSLSDNVNFIFFHFQTTFGCWIPKRFVSMSSLQRKPQSKSSPGHSEAVPFHNETQSEMFSSNIRHHSCQWDCAWSQRVKQLRGNTTGKILHISQTAQRWCLQWEHWDCDSDNCEDICHAREKPVPCKKMTIKQRKDFSFKNNKKKGE